MSNSTPAGWYPDGQGNERWWDGTRWTDDTRPLGGGAPPAPAAPAAPSGDRPGAGTPPSGGAATPPPADATMVAPARGGAPGQPASPAYGAPGGAAPAQPGPPQPGYGAPGGQAPGAGPGTPVYGTPQPGFGGGGGPGIPPNYRQPTPSWAPGGSGGGKGMKMVALIGGALAVLMLLVVVALVFLGGNSPTSVTEDFFSAVQDGDCDGYYDSLSKDTQKLVKKSDCKDDPDEFLNTKDGEGCEIEVSDEKVDGDDATVKYKIKDCDSDDENDSGELDLVKEDGDWKIDLVG